MMEKSKRKLVAMWLILLLLIGGIVWYDVRQSVETRREVAEQVAAAPAHSSTPPKWDSATQGRFITAGLVDSQQRIWIGSEGQGLWLFDPHANVADEWRHLGVDEGVADPNIYAIAEDQQQRIWVGHLRGVSVFNGKAWRNYDATRGPLGMRVFDIGVCPKTAPSAGDVWIATELGLSRYSPSRDRWFYYSRAEGLPSDQANSIAFDRDGTLYLGTQCDGVAIASAGDDYKTWRIIRGPEHLPLQPTGDGLPSSNINRIVVTHDGILFVATDHGLARSADHGKTFTFFRGKDWIAKTQKSIDGPQTDFNPAPGARLQEDYVASIAEDGMGLLWVGYRRKGYECFDPSSLTVMAGKYAPTADYIDMILPRRAYPPLLGTRGFGVVTASGPSSSPAEKSATAVITENFPSPALPPSVEQLDAMTAAVEATKASSDVAAFLGQDWMTQGDWVGRYGREQVVWPHYGFFNSLKKFPYVAGILPQPRFGPHSRHSGMIHYYASLNETSPKVLYAPGRGKRMRGEWNDGGFQSEVYGMDWEGPDLWFDVTIPAGVHRASIYIYSVGLNKDEDRWRDYYFEIKKFSDVALERDQHAPTIVRARVMPAQNPNYYTFLLSEGHYWIRLASNYSHMAGCSAIFFDHADFTKIQADDSTSHYLGAGSTYDPPQPAAPAANDSTQLLAARRLWDALDRAYDHPDAIGMQLPYRMLAYRAALAAGASSDLLSNWRWNLHLWTNEDRADCLSNMAAAWARRQQKAPAH